MAVAPTPTPLPGQTATSSPVNWQAYNTPIPADTNVPAGDVSNNTPTTPMVGTNPTTPVAPVQPQSEDDIYSGYVKQGQSIIDQINSAAASQIAAANQNIDVGAAKKQAAAGLLSSGGNAVSYAGTNASDAATQKNTTDTAISAQAANNVSNYLEQLQTAAQGQANYEQSTAFSQGQTYDQYLKTTAGTTLTGLAKEGVTVQSLKNNPSPTAQQTYATLLQAYGGDENALNAAAALATPTANIVNSWTQGSTLYQVVRDPQTNAVTTQQFDLGVTVPTGWTSNKVSTTTMIMQDPNNPANSIIYSTDPFTGGVTISGTGTGQAIANQYNQSQSNSASTTAPVAPTSTGGTASTTVATALGVDPATPLSEVVSGQGLGALTQAMIANEGGSPQGVVNNPGNVKYTGLPGQTDSGVKATDGGTFASYKTPQDGQKAVADLITEAASGQSSSYGANPTLADFVGTYTNTGTSPTSSAGTGTNGLPTAEYGLLANVAGFDPTKPGVDQDAMKYLQGYLSGTQPTAASLGISTRAGQGGIFDQVSQRAKDLYFKATGQNLPNVTVLKSNLGLVAKNNALLNNLGVQTGVITKNFGLNLQNLSENNVNQAAPVVNKIADALAQATGSTSVAQYLTQNATLQQEIGGLLSIKNASGVTVADKIAAGDLLPSDLSADQQKQILSTFIKEAKNQQQAIGNATATLYQQTDPLGLDPQNPINQPGYTNLTGAGFTPNYDGTYDAPDGTVWQVDAQGNATQVQ